MFVLAVQLLLLPVGGTTRAGETSGHANGKKTDARTATTRRGHHPCGGATVILFQKNKLTAGGRGPTPSRRELFQKNKLTLSTNS